MTKITQAALAKVKVTVPTEYPAYNVCVLLCDDIGVEMLKHYDGINRYPGTANQAEANGLYPQTPNIAALGNAGVTFNSARVAPLCSPSRAGLQAGRYGIRIGVGNVVRTNTVANTFTEFGRDVGVPSDPNRHTSRREYVLAEFAQAAGYKCGLFGKWHLGLMGADGSINQNNVFDSGTLANGLTWTGAGWSHLDDFGKFDHWFANFRNLDTDPQPYSVDVKKDGTYGVPSPASGGHTPNGGWYGREKGDTITTLYNGEAQYADRVKVDKALAWMNASGTEPFVCIVPFSLCHSPYHRPPTNLYTITAEYLTAINNFPTSVWGYYMAMVEALDQEVGRLMAGLSATIAARTVFILMADNGSPGGVLQAARDVHGKTLGADYDAMVDAGENRFKESVYEMGCHVPLLVKGPVVVGAGRTNNAMIDAHVDTFETIRHLLHIRYEDVATDGRVRDGISYLGCLQSVQHGPKLHPRQYQFEEYFSRNGKPSDGDSAQDRKDRAYTARIADDGVYRVLRLKGQADKFFRVANDSNSSVAEDQFEQTPLDISQGGAYRARYEAVASALQVLLNSE